MPNRESGDALFGAIAKGIFLTAGLIGAGFFLHWITEVLLLFAMAGIAAIALSPIVNWLERRKLARSWAAVLVLLGLFTILAGLIAIVAPKLGAETRHLSRDLPIYGQDLVNRARRSLTAYPAIEQVLNDPNLVGRFSPAAGEILGQLGLFGRSVIGLVVGGLVFITSVGYFLAFPRPLLRGLLQAVPAQHRATFHEAMVRGSEMIVRWVLANVIIGVVDGISAMIFLSLIGVQGAFVWGAVTLFAELIPQLGAYLMAIPPLIVTLATDPPKAIWVVVFYVSLQQVVNHLLAPMIRARTMKVHPVSEIFMVLALTLTFGLVGAIIADPVLGFVKAFYDAFYGDRQEHEHLDDQVESLLHRQSQKS